MTDPIPLKKIKILVTGFEPFADDINISEEIVRRLNVRHENVEIITMILPNDYAETENKIRTTIAKEKPDFVISLGEVNREIAPGIRIETVADSQSSQRVCDDAPNWRSKADGELIRASNSILNTALYKSFAQHFPAGSSIDIVNETSNFLCNDAFYTVLDAQRKQGKPGQAIFLHVHDLELKRRDYTDPTLTCAQQDALNADLRKWLDIKRGKTVDNYAAVVSDLIRFIGDHPMTYHLTVRTSSERVKAEWPTDAEVEEEQQVLASAKPTILVTGFEPFDDNYNMSAATIAKLKKTHPNANVVALTLPPEYRMAANMVKSAIRTHKPEFVVSLGEINDNMAADMQIERMGYSQSSMNDRKGDAPARWDKQEAIQLHAKAPNIDSLISQSYALHISPQNSVSLSNYAGANLCNHIYYTALKEQEAQGKKGQAFFLHMNDLAMFEDSEARKAAEKKMTQKEKDFVAHLLGTKRDIASTHYALIVNDLVTYLATNPKEAMEGSEYFTQPMPNQNLVAAPNILASQPLGPVLPVSDATMNHVTVPSLPVPALPKLRQ